MAYNWDKSLETGNAMIDQQHKELIAAMNNLLDACSKGKGRTEIQGTLDFLSGYITKHFSDEEDLQRKYAYPGYAEHKQAHEDFKKVVAEMAAEYAQSGASIVLVAKINTSVSSWLIGHINREDVKIAKHIKEKTQ